MNSTTYRMSGKSKEVVGKLMDNKNLRIRGKLEKVTGDTKSKLDSAADKMSKSMDKITRKIG